MKTPDTIAMKTTPTYTTTRIGMLFSAILLFGGILAIMAPRAQAQIGPGGVGNASGTDGQPENLIWFRGDRGVTTDGSGNVTEWTDQSGNSYSISDTGTPPFTDDWCWRTPGTFF